MLSHCGWNSRSGIHKELVRFLPQFLSTKVFHAMLGGEKRKFKVSLHFLLGAKFT